MAKGRPKRVVSMIDSSNGDVNLDINNVLEEKEISMEEDAVEVVENKEPEYNSPEWSDFVLSKLTADEFRDGAPLVDGLRRVSQVLLGPIVESVPAEMRINDNQTIVSYKISFLWAMNDSRFGQIITFGGVGDATENNCDFPYNNYRGPMAETRAEGRALKKALGLKRILTADEINPKLKVDPKDLATTAQKSGIKNICNKLNIDLNKFVNLVEVENGIESTSMEDMLYVTASQCLQRLNQYQTDSNNKEHLEIPSSILK